MSHFYVLQIQDSKGAWSFHSSYRMQEAAEKVGSGLFDSPSIFAARVYDSRKKPRNNTWLFSKPLPNVGTKAKLNDGDKDYDTPCQNCGEKPTVHPTALCGPCCFGEAETYGGNW